MGSFYIFILQQSLHIRSFWKIRFINSLEGRGQIVRAFFYGQDSNDANLSKSRIRVNMKIAGMVPAPSGNQRWEFWLFLKGQGKKHHACRKLHLRMLGRRSPWRQTIPGRIDAPPIQYIKTIKKRFWSSESRGNLVVWETFAQMPRATIYSGGNKRQSLMNWRRLFQRGNQMIPACGHHCSRIYIHPGKRGARHALWEIASNLKIVILST